MIISGVLTYKAGNKKGFKLDNGEEWYNAEAKVVPFLEKIEVGSDVEVTFEKKGVAKLVSKIMMIPSKASEPQPQEQEAPQYACAVCGKAMKDDKYKVCLMCNKKGLTSKTKTSKEEEKQDGQYKCKVCGAELKNDKYPTCFTCKDKLPKEKSTTGSSAQSYKYYDNPEKTEQIRRGNALNASAAVASSQQFNDVEVAAQFTLELAERFLEWLKA